MALSTYAELLDAIQLEMADSVEITDAVAADLVTRAEAKINRRTRAREQEQLSYATYDATNTTRRVALPSGFLEMLDLRIKLTSGADTTYENMVFVAPAAIAKYYDRDLRYFTLRDELELNALATASYTIMMHYTKRWDIATDSTNWLLTNYPDLYLYGAVCEGGRFFHDAERMQIYMHDRDAALKELVDQTNRSRDDAQKDTSEIAMMGDDYYTRGYNVTTDRWS